MDVSNGCCSGRGAPQLELVFLPLSLQMLLLVYRAGDQSRS